MDEKINIAIDGPAGAGKSTIARKLAQKLHYVYIDTGAMYRAATYYALEHQIDITDTENFSNAVSAIQISMKPGAEGQLVYIDGHDVTSKLRTPEVNRMVSSVAQISAIRILLVKQQQLMAQGKGVVMDGRDVGTKILPDAELKIFLTASVQVRAERRLKEMQSQGFATGETLHSVMRDISNRDQMDVEREVSPLIQADDAYLVDTSSLTIEETVEHIYSLYRSILHKEK